jgi:hypothetical protein
MRFQFVYRDIYQKFISNVLCGLLDTSLLKEYFSRFPKICKDKHGCTFKIMPLGYHSKDSCSCHCADLKSHEIQIVRHVLFIIILLL